MKKTNALRILDSAGIQYLLHQYEVNDDDLSGETVASKIGVDPGRVFKTLVTEGDKSNYVVFCVSVQDELSLKKCAAISNNKRVELIKLGDLFPLTGYIRGGCTPIGMKKPFPVYIDETVMLYDTVFLSAGVRGTQMELKPEDLLVITEGIIGELV